MVHLLKIKLDFKDGVPVTGISVGSRTVERYYFNPLTADIQIKGPDFGVFSFFHLKGLSQVVPRHIRICQHSTQGGGNIMTYAYMSKEHSRG